MIGRPRKLTTVQQSVIRRRIKAGQTLVSLADWYWVDPGTIRYIRDHPPTGGGMPRTERATQIRLVPNKRQPSVFVWIGRTLWEAVGSPTRVDIAPHPRRAGLVIRPGVQRLVDKTLRVSISLRDADAFGLSGTVYPARTGSGAIWVEMNDGRRRCQECKQLLALDAFMPSRPSYCRNCQQVRRHADYLRRKARREQT